MKVTLRQMQVFDAVATHGSITRAADALGMSQSAASAALREFQEALDRPPLVRRRGRSLKITPEGLRLQPVVRTMLNQASEIEKPHLPNKLSGTVSIGIAAAGNYILPRIAVSFRKRHPDVRIDITVGATGQIIELLSSMQIDSVLTSSLTRAPNTYLQECYQERSIMIAAPTHELAHKPDLSFDDLAAAEWCMPNRTSTANIRLLGALRGKIANFRVALEINDDEGIREAVKAGGGISCLPEALIRDDLREGRLVRLDIQDFVVSGPTYLVRLKGVDRSLAAKAFDEYLLDVAPEFVGLV
jgi:DNA-binding transcriptional LysR family regulator